MTVDLLTLNWGLLAPELTIVILSVIITLADLFMKNGGDRKAFAWLSVLGIALATYFTYQDLGQPVQSLLNDTYRVDSFGTMFKLIMLIGTGLVFMMSIYYVDKKEIKYDGEYYYLLLTALLGSMIMASSGDLITLYIGLELLSISSYILAGIRKTNLKSNEAAFKYVVTGSVSSAILLYGASFLYGVTGTTNIIGIAQAVQGAFNAGFDFYIYLGFFMFVVGLGYKISIVPAYMWAPDVYEGAPTPITAFLSVVSKAAGFAIVMRLLFTIFAAGNIATGEINAETGMPINFFSDEMTFYLAVLAGLTMIIGNTMAARQINVKRMFALSSVAQAGYILVPLAVVKINSPVVMNISFSNMIFYLMAYLMMNLGAFAVISLVTKANDTDELKAFAGLYHRNPWIGVAMTFFLLSLAGLPVTAGFIGKFNIFVNALLFESYYLAAIMVVTSVVSYFYYFNIVRQMYMRTGNTEAKLAVPFGLQLVVLLTFLGTVLFGMFPNVLIDFISTNFSVMDLFTPGM